MKETMKTLGQTLYENYKQGETPYLAWTRTSDSAKKEWEDLAETVALAADPYYLFRKALKEGKTVENFDGSKWGVCDKLLFCSRPECYRIKKEFEPTVGEYYKRDTGEIHILTYSYPHKWALVNLNSGDSWNSSEKSILDVFANREDEFVKVNVKIEEKI